MQLHVARESSNPRARLHGNKWGIADGDRACHMTQRMCEVASESSRAARAHAVLKFTKMSIKKQTSVAIPRPRMAPLSNKSSKASLVGKHGSCSYAYAERVADLVAGAPWPATARFRGRCLAPPSLLDSRCARSCGAAAG